MLLSTASGYFASARDIHTYHPVAVVFGGRPNRAESGLAVPPQILSGHSRRASKRYLPGLGCIVEISDIIKDDL